MKDFFYHFHLDKRKHAVQMVIFAVKPVSLFMTFVCKKILE